MFSIVVRTQPLCILRHRAGINHQIQSGHANRSKSNHWRSAHVNNQHRHCLQIGNTAALEAHHLKARNRKGMQRWLEA